jgi:hypothetical protein
MKLYISITTKDEVNVFPESYNDIIAARKSLATIAQHMDPGEVLTLHEYGTGDTMDRWFDHVGGN